MFLLAKSHPCPHFKPTADDSPSFLISFQPPAQDHAASSPPPTPHSNISPADLPPLLSPQLSSFCKRLPKSPHLIRADPCSKIPNIPQLSGELDSCGAELSLFCYGRIWRQGQPFGTHLGGPPRGFQIPMGGKGAFCSSRSLRCLIWNTLELFMQLSLQSVTH